VRVRTPDQFWRQYKKARADYERTYRPQIDKLRRLYSGRGEQPPPTLDDVLEFHARTYLVNALLAALNWRLDMQPESGLPSVAPEIAVRSQQRGTTRFLDYLGFELETNRPLLIVETKRPSTLLPQLVDSDQQFGHEEVFVRGLRGEPLTGDWSDWLETLKDYVVSVQQAVKSAPQRVVITNGDWLVVFLNVPDAFIAKKTPDPGQILIFPKSDDIAFRRAELFSQLEHQVVVGKAPLLMPGELTFHVRPGVISQISHGLRLKYVPTKKSTKTVPEFTLHQSRF
jgi:hypothetical protein